MISAKTLQPLTLHEHIAQSIGTILTTPIGTRVMRRDFGSMLPELIDKPLNGKTRLQVIAASVMAISRWEPRVQLQQISLRSDRETLSVEITGTIADTSIATIQVQLR